MNNNYHDNNKWYLSLIMISIIYYCDVSSQDIIHIARLTVPQVLCARDVPQVCPRCAPDVHRQITELPNILKFCKF